VYTFRLAQTEISSMYRTVAVFGLVAALSGCQGEVAEPGVDARGHTAPTAATRAANAAVGEALPLNDARDFEDARRGLIASLDPLVIPGAGEEPAWNMEAYAFIDGAAPASVNPSLWRQARLNNIHGLFEVTEGVYQLRGFDLANMTLIEGDTGWVLVDPLTTRETAAAALQFANQQLGERPVVAVIFTHSHVDHFGGILGVVDAADVAAGRVEVIAPAGFLEEATSENVIAGTTMGRRSTYMYGRRLDRSERGHVGSGLGKSPAFGGMTGILAPTRLVDHTPQAMSIDGVDFVFQNAPGSEAPAELTFYLPRYRAFCGAELVSRNMHNLYTLRGAKVRDALRWSAYIDEALRLFPETEIYFASHHWPLWGKADVRDFLQKQRDTYKYIHDQTLRLASQGMTPREIAEELRLPESLQQSFPNRGYYGTTRHNAKAVYQAYFGWYDGNPANLDPLPPAHSATRYVQMMGGSEAILLRAREDYDAGDYRWVAELLNHLVFAEPGNREARVLLAASYDQLGYQAESGPWRDVYLTAAYELRHGAPEEGVGISNAADLLRETPVPRFLDLIAAMINGPEAEGRELVINFTFTDLQQNYVLSLSNAVLHHRLAPPDTDANATIELTHGMFMKLILGQASARDIVFSDEVNFEGSELDLLRFFALLDRPDETFDIVVP
jgi:alkyl sulfatase BDS1-like metallo-beta-lactamase superfamily hydrolase